MIENIDRIREEARSQISSAPSTQDLERLRVHYLGKKGLLTTLLHSLKDVDPTKRKELGAVLNQVKVDFEKELGLREEELQRLNIQQEVLKSPPIDVTLPGLYAVNLGNLHPITNVMNQVVSCLRRVGFSIAAGPEIEHEYFNFEALNTPADHPARDMQATFYVDGPILMRTQTSTMQIRVMKNRKPPLQFIAFGKVYRSDYDVTHTPMFHQMEGFMVAPKISFADLKGIMNYIVRNLFGSRPLRFRPSYFPFTEPSAEVDMQCFQCRGSGRDCRLCKSTGWIEIAGCGMIHPNVLKAVNFDPDEVTGFAFGMGIDRVAMLKYGIDDLRSLFENDQRMLEQF